MRIIRHVRLPPTFSNHSATDTGRQIRSPTRTLPDYLSSPDTNDAALTRSRYGQVGGFSRDGVGLHALASAIRPYRLPARRANAPPRPIPPALTRGWQRHTMGERPLTSSTPLASKREVGQATFNDPPAETGIAASGVGFTCKIGSIRFAVLRRRLKPVQQSAPPPFRRGCLEMVVQRQHGGREVSGCDNQTWPPRFASDTTGLRPTYPRGLHEHARYHETSQGGA
jgi:hypothetical protein